MNKSHRSSAVVRADDRSDSSTKNRGEDAAGGARPSTVAHLRREGDWSGLEPRGMNAKSRLVLRFAQLTGVRYNPGAAVYKRAGARHCARVDVGCVTRLATWRHFLRPGSKRLHFFV